MTFVFHELQNGILGSAHPTIIDIVGTETPTWAVTQIASFVTNTLHVFGLYFSRIKYQEFDEFINF